MKNEKIRNALDQSMADMTWKETNRARVLDGISQEQPPVRVFRRALVPALALLLVLFIATAIAGATNEAFNTMLYENFPGLATLLMPVNRTCEDQGIRMELLSAVAKGNEMLLTFSLEDLEGDRIDRYTDAGLNIDFDNGDAGMNYSGTMSPAYDDEDTHKVRFINEMEFDSLPAPRDGQIKATMETIWPRRYSDVDLLPLLGEYGSLAEAMPAPENAIAYAGYKDHQFMICLSEYIEDPWVIPDTLRVLSPGRMPEIPLTDGISLSGIGMVDGRLHVQMHYTDLSEREAFDGEEKVTYYPWEIWITLRDLTDEDAVGPAKKYRKENLLDGGITQLYWEENGETWEEDIFTPGSALTEEQFFAAEITETLEPVFGHWEVTFPLRLIRRTE